MDSPRLPWEVIERVIGHSRHHPNSLRSFSLTCKQLLPCSRCMMLAAGVDLKTRDHVFAFVDFLQDNPHLKPVVRSIIARPTEFAPFPLLHVLSNLSEIAFTSNGAKDRLFCPSVSSLHPSVLTCFQRFGSHLQTLRLFDISFSTYLAFAHLVLAFSSITHLVCTNVHIETRGNRAPLETVKQRMSKKLQLKSLCIDSWSIDMDNYCPSVARVLLDPGFKLAQSTVESLHVIDTIEASQLDLWPEWPRLQSLKMHFSRNYETISKAIRFLQNVNSTRLKNVVLEVDLVRICHLIECLRSGICKKLDQVLLKIAEVGITWTLKQRLRDNRSAFWTQELRKHFPNLSQRGMPLIVESNTVFSAGHDDTIRAFACSSDSKFIASASEDSSIVLWDTRDGGVAHQWTFPNYEPVRSLAFSPDRRYLLCGSAIGKVAIWDLWEGMNMVKILEAHCSSVTSCAWSPDGTIFATACFDGAIHLWDASTFHVLHILHDSQANRRLPYIAFSPDGRWLVFSCFSSSVICCIWTIPQGTLHKVIEYDRSDYHGSARQSIAVFNPGSTRIATTSGSSQFKIWDIQEKGRRTFIARSAFGINALLFSPDGQLVLAALQNKTMKVWDVDTGVKLMDLKRHRGGVLDACFSPCGKYIASAAADDMVLLWRARDGTCLAELSEHKALVKFVAFTPDGKTLSSAAEDGTVVIRQMHDIVQMDEQAL